MGLMKTISVTFLKEELKTLKKFKGATSWHNAILKVMLPKSEFVQLLTEPSNQPSTEVSSKIGDTKNGGEEIQEAWQHERKA